MLPILNQSLWRDEAFSALLSEKSPLQIITLTMQDTTPPLHYLLLHYWMRMFGSSEVALRGLSFLFHLLTVFVVFFIIRRFVKSPLVHILVVLTTLLNPFLLQYAFEARAYSLLAFLSVLAVYFAISKKYVLASIVLALAVFTHNFALFMLVAFACWFFNWNRTQIKEKKTDLIELFAAPVIAVLLWGSVVWQQWTKVASGFWIKPATFSLFLNSFEKYSRGDLSYPTQPMLYVFTLVLCFFAFSYWAWKEQKEEQGKELSLLLFVVIIPTLITYVISALFSPIYDERYLIATVPIFIILVGYSLSRLLEVKHRLKNIVVGAIAIYMALLIQSSEQIVSMTTKPPINYAVSQVLSQVQFGDVILSRSDLNFLETKWYVQQSGRLNRVYTYVPSGNIPFYIGAVLFEPQEILTQIPKGVRVWGIKADGGYELVQQ